MRFVLLLSFFVICVPVLGHAQTKFSTSSSSNKKDVPAWAEDIASKDGNRMQMKSGRVYSVSKGAVSEVLSIPSVSEITNVYDFAAKVIYHKIGGTTRAISVTPFSNVSSEHVREVQDYGCYIVDGLRETEVADFNKQYCK